MHFLVVHVFTLLSTYLSLTSFSHRRFFHCVSIYFSHLLFLLFTFLFFSAIYLPMSCTYSTSIFSIAFSQFFRREYILSNFYLSYISPLVITCFLNANLSICSSLHAFPCARYESSAASARSTSGKARGGGGGGGRETVRDRERATRK